MLERKEGTVRLVAGGDTMFTERLSALSHAATEGFRRTIACLQEADIRIANCETPLTRGGYRSEKFINLRSDPEIAEDLAALGVDIVTLANNHMLDYGYEGLFHTLEAFQRAGVATIGAGRNLGEAISPHYRELGGRRFAFLAVATTLPPGSAADVDRPGIAPIRVATSFEVDPNVLAEQPGAAPTIRTRAHQGDLDRVCDAVAAARREADHVVAAIHWGLVRTRVVPRQGPIAEYQPPVGKALIDAGADLVLGNHSHNLQGVEVYRDRPIFYSLGNFLFQHLRDWHEPESVLVLADFGQVGTRVLLVPLLVNGWGFPEMARGEKAVQVARVLEERSKPFGTRFALAEEGIAFQLSEAR